jgi:hypothetical protein
MSVCGGMQKVGDMDTMQQLGRLSTFLFNSLETRQSKGKYFISVHMRLKYKKL